MTADARCRLMLFPMVRLWGAPLLAAVTFACGDDPVAPGPAATSSAPQILDGARQGNPHFFFLPPLVLAPTYAGIADPDASPSVVVCDWISPAGQPSRCNGIIASFSLAEGTGSEVIRYDAGSQSYIVNWHTDRCLSGPCTLDPNRFYRIRVLVGATELGHADVDPVSSGKELKNMESQESVPLLNGRTLPLKFRIEKGAVNLVPPGMPASIGPQGGDIATSDGQVALSFPSGALGASTPITVAAAEAYPETGEWARTVDLGPDGSTFSKPVTLTIAYDPTKLPTGVIPEALKLSTWVDDHWEEVPGSTLNVGDGTISGPVNHFSTYGLVIWPNAVQGTQVAGQLTVGQQATVSGYVWVYQTYPAQYCYTYSQWISTGWGRGYYVWRQQCYNYTQSYYYYPTGARVYWGSSVPNVVSVAPPQYSITGANGSTTSPLLSALRPGQTTITGWYGSVSATTSFTVLPSLVFDLPGTGTSPLRRLGMHQITDMSVRVPAPVANQLPITVTHRTPAVATSLPALFSIPFNATRETVTLIGNGVAGRDTAIASANGYGPDTLVVEVDRGRVAVEGWPATLAYGDSVPLRITAMSPDSTLKARVGMNIVFALDGGGRLVFSRGAAAITSITVTNGDSLTPTFYVKGVTTGAATMTVTSPYYNTAPYNTAVSTNGKLVFDVFGTGTAPFRKFGFGQGTGMNVRIPQPVSTALPVALTHSNPAVAGSNSGLVISAGATQNGVTIGAGQTAGRDTLIGTAPGYDPDTLVIETGPGRVYVEFWPSSLAYGDSAPVRVRPMNQDSTIIDNAWGHTFALASDGKLAFSRNNAPITSITIPDGTSSSPVFYVKATGSGAATMTVTHPLYITGPYPVTVSAPPFTSISVTPNPAGVPPGQTVQLTGVALDATNQPVAGVPLTWSSANTAIATVNSSGRVTGVSNGNVNISATSGGVTGSALVKVGTPSIAPSTGSLTIPVQQGQVRTATININNGGGGLLTGLQAGSFSNYYNGSPAPWATATFNTTTAPAIMTITVAPGLNIDPGIHLLRFDVVADGGLSYTFFSISITVIDKDITPVNATISPSAGSASISVPAGQTRTATITINNTGTDPLTQLTTGPFSNYFNGSPAPWVTASIAPTTAPATLTITASPSINEPPGTHPLRFDVMSPGATNSPYTFFSINVTVTAPVDPPFLAGGGKSTCALRADRTVICWGETSNGATAASSGTFATIGGGFFHYCGIRPDQSLNCWGYNSDLRATPPTTGTYNRISVGPEHNCALRTDNTAVCWGFGGDGRSSPPAGEYKQIGVGWYHGCGVRSDDTVVCWGQNGSGQSTPLSGTFKSVSGGSGWTCGIRTDDTIACWGNVAAPPPGAFRQVASASAGGHVCAIRSDETLTCWGQNDFGQSNAPAGQYLQVVTNYLQSCAVRKDRVVVCWGSNATGAISVPAALQTP